MRARPLRYILTTGWIIVCLWSREEYTRHVLLSTKLTRNLGFVLFVSEPHPTSQIVELDLSLCVDDGSRSLVHCVQLELLVLAIVEPSPVGIQHLRKRQRWQINDDV